MTETRSWTRRRRSLRMVGGACALVHHTETSPRAQQLRVGGIDIALLVVYVVRMDDTGTVARRTRTTSRAGGCVPRTCLPASRGPDVPVQYGPRRAEGSRGETSGFVV